MNFYSKNKKKRENILSLRITEILRNSEKIKEISEEKLSKIERTKQYFV